MHSINPGSERMKNQTSHQKVIEEWDIHAQLRQKVEELNSLTDYLDTILNHISQGIVFIDLEGIVITYNKAAEEALGVEQAKVLFHPFSDFFSDDILGFSLKEALHNRVCPEICFISLSNKNKKIEIEAAPLFILKKVVTPYGSSRVPFEGMVIRLRNITELRRLQTIAARNERLKELGEITARMAHEIRNPLTGIRGFATLLVKDLADKPELQKIASHILEGTESLNTIVTNILNYSRPLQPHFETIDLVPFLEEIKETLQANPDFPKGIQIELYSQNRSMLFSVDPNLLKGALLNLALNSIEAMPNGGCLEIRIMHGEKEFEILVRDTGVGIPAENMEKIFAPFFTTKPAGNGLGLAQVHKVILAHGGTIEVYSVVGEGTTFTIKLPVKL